MMRPVNLDDTMMRLKRGAQEREGKLGHRAGRDPSNLADDEETGAAMNEHPDTWGFSWMPAIEEFVEQEAARATDDERDYDSDDETENGHNERYGSSEDEGRGRDGGGHRELSDGVRQVEGAGMDSARSGRKRTRFRMSGGPSSSCRRQQPPPPPSYNETLLADKSFHNPNASETMADAFGIVHPASFILDVRTDDRTWGGAAVAAAAAQAAAIGGKASGAAGGAGDREGLKKAEEEAEEEAGSGGDRNWFYDTVRDRQNRLWADTRVRKGVELARKGQHQAAIDIYTQALGMCPDHDDGLVARGAAFATTGRLRQAMQDLSRAQSLNPENENASTYLKETRRRMERQDARGSPVVGTAFAPAVRGLATDSSLPDADDDAAGGAWMLRAHEGDSAASQSALKAMLQDGVEGDALRKMRVLLEDDERKRKRDRRSGVGSAEGLHFGDGDESSHKGKKSRKKEKKTKSRHRSSGRHKRDREKEKERERRKSTSGKERYNGSDSSDSSGSSSNESDVARSKKKKKRRHAKSKKRSSRAQSTSPSHSSAAGRRNGGGVGGPMAIPSASLAAGAEDSGEEEAHPILQRKKHSLWG